MTHVAALRPLLRRRQLAAAECPLGGQAASSVCPPSSGRGGIAWPPRHQCGGAALPPLSATRTLVPPPPAEWRHCSACRHTQLAVAAEQDAFGISPLRGVFCRLRHLPVAADTLGGGIVAALWRQLRRYAALIAPQAGDNITNLWLVMPPPLRVRSPAA